MEDKTKIDELFKQGLGRFEAEPPEESWQNIREELHTAKRRKRIVFWRIASTAAAVVLAFFGGYYFQLTTQKVEPALHEMVTEPVEQPSENNENNTSGGTKMNESEVSEKSANDGLETKTSSEKSPAKSLPEKSKMNIPDKTIAHKQPGITSPLSTTAEDKPQKLISIQNTPADIAEEDLENITPEASRDVPITTPKPTLNTGAGEGDVAAIEKEKPAVNTAGPEKTKTAATEEEFTYVDLDKEAGNKRNSYPNNRFELGIAASPTLAFSDVNAPPDNVMNQTIKSANGDDISQTDDVLNSYAGGLNFSYRTASRWEVSTGFHVNQWKQVSRDVVLESSPGSISTNANYTVTGNTSTGTLNYDVSSFGDTTRFENLSPTTFVLVPDVYQQYQFVEVPVKVGYYILDARKWTFKVQAGMSGRFLTGSDVNLVFDNGKEEKYDGLELRNFTLQFSGGMGLGYNASKNLRINLTPTVLYGLTPVNQNEGTSTYFHQVLIYSGFSYGF